MSIRYIVIPEPRLNEQVTASMITVNSGLIYVDDLIWKDKLGRLWCHCWHSLDNREELDNFAIFKLGLKPSYAHLSKGPSGEFYHYDLVKSKRDLALRLGAVYMNFYDWVRLRLKEKNYDL